MKTFINIFTDNTPNNSFTELTQGQLHIAIIAIVVFAIGLTVLLKKAMKEA
jgi:L-cystine uptake protein TcyP (sodium:dicarboxylate symporter family)